MQTEKQLTNTNLDSTIHNQNILNDTDLHLKNKMTPFTQLTVTFHYYRKDQDYTKWFLHYWSEDIALADTHCWKYGQSNGDWKSITVTLKATPDHTLSKVGFIIAKKVDEHWEKDGTTQNRFIEQFTAEGTADVWIVDQDPNNYPNRLATNVDKQIKSAILDSFYQVTITFNRPVTEILLNSTIELKQNRQPVEIYSTTEITEQPNCLVLQTQTELDCTANLTIEVTDFGKKELTIGAVVRHPDFDKKYAYTGSKPLGFTFDATNSCWRLWAPTAKKVSLILYQATTNDSAIEQKIPMIRQKNHLWEVYFPISEPTAYQYELTFANDTHIVSTDPYAKAATVNGIRAVALDLSTTNPENWEKKRMPAFSQETQAIIYEIHIRDFSIANPEVTNKGKFLGVIQEGTKTKEGYPTGIDYLKKLGITHTQLLPMADYATLDERNHLNQTEKLDALAYNWGYDPENYNVPEGSYSTNPLDPVTRIKEMKQMIQGLHRNGLRVIMDVVYNHVYLYEYHAFEKTVPGYYFRYTNEDVLSNGTGVGNDTASERTMMRKFIVDSVLYWATEYHVDGFRFDLMGIHDIQTMNTIRKALDAIDPSILILGEGWNLGTSLADESKASYQNASQMPRIAHFNDSFRDTLKGSTWGGVETAPGFINGALGKEPMIAQNLLAGSLREYGLGIHDFTTPNQVIQYVEAHDNLTLWDKLTLTNPDDSDEQKKKRQLLANSLVLLAQGIPFLHAGQEFFRTKKGDSNSYRSPNSINALDWELYANNQEAISYLAQIIDLRKKEPLFHLNDYENINKKMKIFYQEEQVVAYELAGEEKNYLVFFNASLESKTKSIPSGHYEVLIGNTQTNTLSEIQQVELHPLSTLILSTKLPTH